MTVQIILRIAIVAVIVSEASTILKGDDNAVCTRVVSHLGSQILSSLEKYRQAEGLHLSSPFKTRTKLVASYYPAWVVEQICCSGYEDNKGTCEPRCVSPCKNGYCAQPDVCACNAGYQPSLNDVVSVCEPIPENHRITRSFENQNCTEGCSSGNFTAGIEEELTCDDGYEQNTNGTCDPICNTPCINGECDAPDNCTCNEGYEMSSGSNFTCDLVRDTGDPCEEATLCVVVQPVSVGSMNTGVSNLPKSNGTDQEPPACRPECLDQLGSTQVKLTKNNSDFIHHFIPIDSPCNVVAADLNFLIWHRTVIGTVCGIIIFVLIIYIAYFLTMRVKRRNRLTSESMKCLYSNYEKMGSTNEEY